MSRFTTPLGFKLSPQRLGATEQARLIETVLSGVAASPLYQPAMPRTGKPLSVRMTNFGPLGWVTEIGRAHV